MGAFDRRPQLRREQRLVGVDPRGQQPGLAGGDHGRVGGFAPQRSRIAEVAVARRGDPLDGAAAGRPRAGTPGEVPSGQCAMPDGAWLPQRLGEPLRAAGDEPVLVVGVGVDDAEDLQDGVGEVGVPAAGAEARPGRTPRGGEAASVNASLPAMKP